MLGGVVLEGKAPLFYAVRKGNTMNYSNTITINGLLNCTDKAKEKWEIITNTDKGLFAIPVSTENSVLFDDICDTVHAEIDGELIPWAHGAVAIKPLVIETVDGVHNELLDN